MRIEKWVMVVLVTMALPVPAEESTAPSGVEPEFIRQLVAFENGRNDARPVWSPSGNVVAVERSRGENREIVIARLDGRIIETVSYRADAVPGQTAFFFPGVVEQTSYNAGITWSPSGDRFVFMSNGGEGNYDLFLREPDSRAGNQSGWRTVRLTTDKEKDGHAHWSPVQDRIVFISGRTGKGDVYLLNLAAKSTVGAVTLLAHDDRHSFLYPQWSPDGKRIAVIRGTNENHDIYVLDPERGSSSAPKALTTWTYDDLRPVWSSDGKRLAFYTNYNTASDPRIWAIAVVAADGSDPTEGDGLAARIVVTDVIPDVERGPAWMPDSRRIVYVRNDKQAYNPVHIADVETHADTLVRTGTKINHDVACSRDGTIAFRAQVEQWDQIFVMKLKE